MGGEWRDVGSVAGSEELAEYTSRVKHHRRKLKARRQLR